MNIEIDLAKKIIIGKISHIDTHYSESHFTYYSITNGDYFVWCYSNNAWVNVKTLPDDLIDLDSLEKDLFYIVESEGRKAFSDEQSRYENPYPKQSVLFDGWDVGWQALAAINEPSFSDSVPR